MLQVDQPLRRFVAVGVVPVRAHVSALGDLQPRAAHRHVGARCGDRRPGDEPNGHPDDVHDQGLDDFLKCSRRRRRHNLRGAQCRRHLLRDNGVGSEPSRGWRLGHRLRPSSHGVAGSGGERVGLVGFALEQVWFSLRGDGIALGRVGGSSRVGDVVDSRLRRGTCIGLSGPLLGILDRIGIRHGVDVLDCVDQVGSIVRVGGIVEFVGQLRLVGVLGLSVVLVGVSGSGTTGLVGVVGLAVRVSGGGRGGAVDGTGAAARGVGVRTRGVSAGDQRRRHSGGHHARTHPDRQLRHCTPNLEIDDCVIDSRAHRRAPPCGTRHICESGHFCASFRHPQNNRRPRLPSRAWHQRASQSSERDCPGRRARRPSASAASASRSSSGAAVPADGWPRRRCTAAAWTWEPRTSP